MKLFSFQNITDEALVHLAMGCPFLRALSVSLCQITDVGLRALAGTLTPSTAAEILGINPIAGPPVHPFQRYHHHHNHHHTNGHPGFGGPGGRRLRPASESHHHQHHPHGGASANGNATHRNSLALTAPSSPTGWWDEPKPLVVSGCRELRVLEASQCVQLTDAGLTALARNCNNVNRVLLTRFQ